jgi:hypothetical protein
MLGMIVLFIDVKLAWKFPVVDMVHNFIFYAIIILGISHLMGTFGYSLGTSLIEYLY